MTSNETTRALFEQELKHRQENREALNNEVRAINSRLLDAYEAAATVYQKAVGKKRGKKPYHQILPQDKIDEIKKLFEGEYEQAVKESNASLRLIDLNLLALADTAEVLPGPPTEIKRITKYDFSTQPCAAAYAEGVAKTYAECYRRFHHLEADVVFENDGWTVFVNVADKVDLEIIRRKGEGPVLEIVRLLLKRGLNPKAVNQLFPFPEQVGLDWQGNDLKRFKGPERTN